jgi:hypothetical protein
LETEPRPEGRFCAIEPVDDEAAAEQLLVRQLLR